MPAVWDKPYAAGMPICKHKSERIEIKGRPMTEWRVAASFENGAVRIILLQRLVRACARFIRPEEICLQICLETSMDIGHTSVIETMAARHQTHSTKNSKSAFYQMILCMACRIRPLFMVLQISKISEADDKRASFRIWCIFRVAEYLSLSVNSTPLAFIKYNNAVIQWMMTPKWRHWPPNVLYALDSHYHSLGRGPNESFQAYTMVSHIWVHYSLSQSQRLALAHSMISATHSTSFASSRRPQSKTFHISLSLSSRRRLHRFSHLPQHSTSINLWNRVRFHWQAKGNYLTAAPALRLPAPHSLHNLNSKNYSCSLSAAAASQNTTCQSFITAKVLSTYSSWHRDKVSLRRIRCFCFGRCNFGLGHTRCAVAAVWLGA